MKKLILFFLLISAVYSCRKKHWKCDEQVSFKNEVQPLLTKHCAGCHSAYDKYSTAKILASDGSFTDEVINSSRMPKNGRLTKTERKKLFCWIEQGALDN